MDRNFRKLIDVAKEEMAKQGHGISAANKLVGVSGTRYKLPLSGREVEIVLYPPLDQDGNRLEGKYPLIVGYHGGGFVFGGCALDDEMWKAVTQGLSVYVASVDYRKSPAYKWKETLDDAFDAAVYLSKHADEFGFDGKHISVMGQSAGGNLSAAVGLRVNTEKAMKLDNIILIYPFLDVHTDPNSKGPGSLVGPACYAMNEMHCDYEETLNPLVSPVYAGEDMLKGLPNVIIDYSEDDNLKFEGMKFAENLKKAGVTVHENLSEGMPHGFFECGFKIPTEIEINLMLGENARVLIETGAIHEKAVECINFIKENFVK